MILNISSRAIFNDFQRSIYHVYTGEEGGDIYIYMQLENVLFAFSITYTLMQHGNKLPMFRVITRQNCSNYRFVFLNID